MAGKRKTDDAGTRHDRRSSAEENHLSKRRCFLKEKARDWDVEEVVKFLEDEQLEEFVPIFIGEKITGRVLCDINDDVLEKMGIEAVGDRLKILQTLKPFREGMCVMPFHSIRNEFKVFNDAIHGHIELHPLCVKIVDTPQFQRLRYIKQLGGCYFVFPGASHNRFEHCIGVCYLAGQLVMALNEKQPELNITDTDMLCVQIAGLCHDLGHGPFSHLFDGKFIPTVRPGRNWKHEEASVDMFDYMVESCDLIPEFEKYGLTARDRIFIKEQIAGPLKENKGWPYTGRDVEKSFLYEIVANKRNGIDVDKWDYFDRDCHMLGIKNNFDHVRFMKFARVCDFEGELQLCSRDKEVGNLYDMFHTRSALHRRAYQHKNNNIVETMIVEAMVKADDHIRIPGRDGKPRKMSETIDDMAAFCKLTDHIFHLILLSTEPELKEARTILENIQRRKLYKCIGQTVPKSGVKLPEDCESKIREEISKAMTEEELGRPQLKPDDFVIHIINLDYGMKEKNPIDHVRFYMKSNPNVPIRMRKEQVSQMLPEKFAEQQIRCYCKQLDEDRRSVATRCFERWCALSQMTTPKGGDPLAMDLTPLKQSDNNASPEVDTGTTPKRNPALHPGGKFQSRLSFN